MSELKMLILGNSMVVAGVLIFGFAISYPLWLLIAPGVLLFLGGAATLFVGFVRYQWDELKMYMRIVLEEVYGSEFKR